MGLFYEFSVQTDLDFKNMEFRHFLQHELVARCQRNASYSLRSFAKSLDISSSALSALINGKRPITEKMRTRLGLALGLSPEQILHFKTSALSKNKKETTPPVTIQLLTLDTYAIISDWYHYAILELLKLKNFKPSAQSISSKLGITKSEANIAIERLQRTGLLEIDDTGAWQDTCLNGHATNITGNLTSAASKKLQRQILEMSIQALQEVSIEERSHTSITVALNPRDIELAKEKIKIFRRELAEFFEKNDEPSEVYHLAVSLYPITKKIEGEKL